MSESDRDGDSKTGLKRWLWPAIIFAVAVLAIGGVQHWLHYEDAARNAASYARDAKDQIATECLVLETYPSCAREIEQTRRENQRNEYDLYAQKTMALWTAIMGGMATLGIALSGVGIYLIWRTWDATREAAENSRKTLDSYLIRERALLRFGHASYLNISDDPVPDGFQVDIVNHGPSPGDLQSVEWEYLPAPLWPKKLRFEKFTTTIVAADNEPTTPHLSCENIQEIPLWLAVRLNYISLGNAFQSHHAFRIEYSPPDGYGPGRYFAISQRLSDQPFDS